MDTAAPPPPPAAGPPQRRRRIVVLGGLLLAAGALSLLAVMLLGASEPPGRVLWRADGSQPLHREWASYATADRCFERDDPLTAPGATSSRALLTRDVGPSEGRPSYSFTVADGDDCSGERAELGQGNPSKPGLEGRMFRRGDDVWVGYQFLITGDSRPVTTWQCIGQFKAEGLGGPVFCPGLIRDTLSLERADSTEQESVGSRPLWSAGAPVMKDRWIKYLFHIRFDPDPEVGFVEFWADLADGEGLQERIGHARLSTMKLASGTTAPVPVHPRIGIYRDEAAEGTGRAYFAGYTVGTGRGSVEDAAFGG